MSPPPLEPTHAALEATRSIRRSRGYAGLAAGERAALERDLSQIERALIGNPTQATVDPYAVPLETPMNLRGGGLLGPGGPPPMQTGAGSAPPLGPPPAAPPPRAPTGTEGLGERARRALDAVDFPSFVAGLIHGTFRSIVDATAQQVREYAKLVADISKSVDEFTRDNVNPNQARDYLVDKHPADLTLVFPRPGEPGEPRVVPRVPGASPAWLADYGLEGEELTPELVDGALVQSARKSVGEDRMRTLATMVLMGINRIVVDDGQIRARLQFHAKASERMKADVTAQTGGQQLGIAGQSSGLRSAVSTMVSTVDVNAQSDISIKADLVGEVSVRFRTETFDLQRFADSQAISLITRHAQQLPAANGGAAAPAPAPVDSGRPATPRAPATRAARPQLPAPEGGET
jgi:hypothetical protein